MFPKDTEQQLFHYICEALSAVVHEKRITALFPNIELLYDRNF